MAEPARYSVPQVARLLGISERAVRKRISAGSLQAEREGGHWSILLAEPEGGTGAVPGGTETEPDGTERGTTPAEVERAIEATAARYVADFAGLYDRISTEVAARYEQTIAAKDETIATQAALIAELRRQASPQPLSEAPPLPTHRAPPTLLRALVASGTISGACSVGSEGSGAGAAVR